MTTEAPHSGESRRRRDDARDFRIALVIIVVAALAYLGWWDDTVRLAQNIGSRVQAVASARQAPTVTAQPVNLTGVTVAPDRTVPGYSRALFGPAWADTDRNGCDQRNDVLARDLQGVTRRGRCVVVAGTLIDPYTQRTIRFVKADASAVQIDHMVALAWAWRHGASSWSPARREQYATDPHVLTAVSGDENRLKSDQGPAVFLANRWVTQQGRCTYAQRAVWIARAYHLTITSNDVRALTGALTDCGGTK